jgi:hypothetical protein
MRKFFALVALLSGFALATPASASTLIGMSCKFHTQGANKPNAKVATPGKKPEPGPANSTEVEATLKDGKLIGADGKSVPDGEYTSPTGVTVVVKNGAVSDWDKLVKLDAHELPKQTK